MVIYECVLIFNKNATEGIDKSINNIFVPNLAKNINIEKLGVKKLAYQIREENEAFYVKIKFEAEDKYIQQFERKCRPHRQDSEL